MPNDLDDRIRDLVSAAVADAPPAPSVDTSGAAAPRRPNWLKRGALALAALLTGIGGVVVLQPANKGNVDTTQRPGATATTQFAPRDEPSVIVTAGPDGIRENIDGVERVVSTQRVGQAFRLDDGGVVALGGAYSAPGYWDNQPIRIAADGTVTHLFDRPQTADWFEIHDFSVVDGRRLLLYSEKVNTASVDSAKQTLYTMDLDTKEVTEIAKIGDAFSSADVLSLGSNGLIVGTKMDHRAANTQQLLVLALPGSPAATRPLPKPPDYALESSYAADCACPTNYFTDATGTSLYWVSTLPDGTGTAVYSARIAEPGKAPTMVKELPAYGATVEQTFPDIGSRGVVVSYANRGDAGPIHAPVLLQGDTVVELGGYYATVGWQG